MPSRGEVGLGWPLGSGALSFPGRGQECCLLPLPTFEVNIRKERRVFYLRNAREKGQFLSLCHLNLFAAGSGGGRAEGTASQRNRRVVPPLTFPSHRCDGTAICGAVL